MEDSTPSVFGRIQRYLKERPAMDAVRDDICMHIELGGSEFSEKQMQSTIQHQRDVLPAFVGLVSGVAATEGFRRLGMSKAGWIVASIQCFAWPYMATRVNNDVLYMEAMMGERHGIAERWRQMYRENLPKDVEYSLADDVENAFEI